MTVPSGDDPQRRIIPYHSSRERGSGRAAGMTTLGFLLGILGVAAVGIVLGIVNFEPSTPPFGVIVLFFGLMIAAGIGAAASFTRGRRWFFMGLCIGVAVMALVEGICFTN